MPKIVLIGDVHCHVYKYKAKVEALLEHHKADLTIQIGDFGFKWEHDWFLENMNYNVHKVLFGNHDYLPYLDKPHSLGNWAVFEEAGIMCIRGAHSIDKEDRTDGLNWFENEELDGSQFLDLLYLYRQIKPRIVVSHTAPSSVAGRLIGFRDNFGKTEQVLQQMLNTHKPKFWVFGHFHQSTRFMFDNVDFRCLSELGNTVIQ